MKTSKIKQKSPGECIFDVANFVILGIVAVITIYPLIHVIMASFSNGYALMTHQGLLFKPVDFDSAAYKMVFRNPMILRGFLNTIYLVIVGTSVNMLLTSFGAYVLSRKRVVWQKFIMIFIVVTMFFQGGLIPLYLQVRFLKLYNTHWSLILTFAIDSFNLIVMRTYFMGIPDSLEESARIDGAHDFIILFRIILPVATPVVATLTLFYAVSRWNGYFYAMIFLKDRVLYPISLVLREILIIGSTDNMMIGASVGDRGIISETIKYATATVATVPILLVYPFIQKYFAKGAMIGAIKG